MLNNIMFAVPFQRDAHRGFMRQLDISSSDMPLREHNLMSLTV
jgi:hypothetical protein